MTSLATTTQQLLLAGNATNATESSVADLYEASGGLEAFSRWYEAIHGYVSVGFCVVGIVFNIMNIVVLTRKNMLTSTNTILTALAFADMFTMLSYLPYAAYFYCYTQPNNTALHSRGWIIYLIFNQNFIITLHTISMWLTVSLAVFRYIVVCHHTLGPRLCTIHRARVTIVGVVVGTILFSIPNYVMHVPEKIELDGEEGYWFNYSAFVTDFMRSFNNWLYGVVMKIAPCVLLTVLSALLIRAMHEHTLVRRRLRQNGSGASTDADSETNRTTAMLVAVVLCFVATEVPQGILAFLSGIDPHIFNTVYVPLGDVFDIMVLINSSVNFLLYCTMSRQFRTIFKEVFCSMALRRQQLCAENGTNYIAVNSTAHPTNNGTRTTRL